MERLAGTVEERLQNVRLKVYPVENDFFGGKVSVTGLLTGHDLLRSLKGRILESYFSFPEACSVQEPRFCLMM